MEENSQNHNYSNNNTIRYEWNYSYASEKNNLSLQNLYNEQLEKNHTKNNLKNEMSSLFDNQTEKIKSAFESIFNRTDEMIFKFKNFRDYFDIYLTDMTELDSQISNQSQNYALCNNLQINDKLKNISDSIEKLDVQISTFIKEIKNKIEKINEESVETNQENKNSNKNEIHKIYFTNNKSDDNNSNFNFNVKKNIFVENSQSKFGLDNQFELVEYNQNNYLLIYINNFNDLILKLINKTNNKIINSLIIKNLFPDCIREIRYFSDEFEIKEEDEENDYITQENKNINFLLVSSQKNELKIFEVLFTEKNFENTLKEISHIKDIYKKPDNYINKDFFDLSSCVLRLQKKDLFESELYTTCWEGNYIKIYNLFTKELKTEIFSKTSCNIKYCDLLDNQFLLFCGCNKQDNYTCANCIDLNIINFSIPINENIKLIKYRDECLENKENVHFNLYVYQKNNKKYILICDGKGYLRLFDFLNQNLLYKIYPSKMNKIYKYDETKINIKRLNSIMNWNNLYLLITERNTGYVFIIYIEVENEEKMEVVNCFNLFTTEVISIRKYHTNQFLVLGKDISNLDNDLEQIEMLKKIEIDL